jgi:hypothetical protein
MEQQRVLRPVLTLPSVRGIKNGPDRVKTLVNDAALMKQSTC